MANTGAVWGIDIGQCALKALRCRPHDKDAGRIVVEAFDYIEYPKILSQPDADREELIREALETFLSRNEVQGDRIAMSVPGQSGLARFIKLPPVEAKKIPDIVKYEARQQIPFALEDVVWDYQPLLGGSQDEGYALETEVGLFAMKRDQVARALAPLDEAGLEVDAIQLAPLSVYNFVCFDRLNNLEGDDETSFDPEDPPASTLVLSFGADTTDLVITNGYRVWQRNIPIGGTHFTKALTKEMRITFAKAEHLKRNATKAENPKAVFQAMRPVFSDLVAEIQRSIGFYMSNNRQAKLGEVIALGNPMKLPGLERYLAQNLEQPIKPIEEYAKLVGGSVTAAPQFKENLLSFAVAYGLCLQGLGVAQLKTNLLPDEIVTQRLVRAKKPWAAAAAAILMIGLTANFASHVASWRTVDVENDWKRPIAESKQVTAIAGRLAGDNQDLQSSFNTIKTIGENLQSNTDGRLLWLELFKAVDSALPKDPRPIEERQKTALDVTQREELHIESMDCQSMPDVSAWFAGPVEAIYRDQQKSEELKAAYEAQRAEAAAAAAASGADDPDAAAPDDESVAGVEEESDPYADTTGGLAPSGPGWIIQLEGYHFHNSSSDPENRVARTDEGAQFVRRTLIKNLLEGAIQLPDGVDENGVPGKMIDVSLAELGVSYPVMVTDPPIEKVTFDPNAVDEEGAQRRRPAAGFGGFGKPAAASAADGDAAGPELWDMRRYRFIVQFVWQPRPRHERQAARAAEQSGDAFDETAARPIGRARLAERSQR